MRIYLKFETSLICIVSSRTARLCREILSQKQNQKFGEWEGKHYNPSTREAGTRGLLVAETGLIG